MPDRKTTVGTAAARQPSHDQDRRPRRCPLAPRTRNIRFEGKTEDMNKKIFDFGPAMASDFADTHRELIEYVSRLPKGGHGAAKAIKDLVAPAYSPPDYPDLTEEDVTAPVMMIPMDAGKAEMLKYQWKQESDIVWEKRKQDTRNLEHAYGVAYGQ
mmetsp:Transcript_15308/g.44461  ORF Transcript_15308/g.44461 Transcript_15308/m.44461 type:complete len:156 (-) Transcript_15308:982-1449(-)